MMKLLMTIFILLIASGCTTIKPVELSPEQLHEQIYAGDIIQLGDNVKIITSDGMHYKFKVTAITENSIVGEEVNIPIMDIVEIETREFRGGPTTALITAGVVLSIVFTLGMVVGL